MKNIWICLVLVTLANIHFIHAQKVPAESAPDPKEKPALVNSYLPAAMQVLAHITNQLKVAPAPGAVPTPAPTPSTTTSSTTTTSTTTTTTTTRRPQSTASTTRKPLIKEPLIELTPSPTTSTQKPIKDDLVALQPPPTPSPVETTPAHHPAIFAPPLPPSQVGIKAPLVLPVEEPFIPPIVHEHTAIEYPQPLYLPNQQQNEFIPPVLTLPNQPLFVRNPQPILDANFPVLSYQPQIQAYPNPYFHLPPEFSQYPTYFVQSRISEDSQLPDISSLPVQNEDNYKANPLELEPDELSAENLQYLSPVVRELLQGIHGPVEEVEKYGNPAASFQSIEDLYDDEADRQNVYSWLRLQKAGPSQSLIQMLLLYDMLGRDAKMQKLNRYNGYPDDLIGDLSDISKVSAADQLKTVLDRMVARGDCKNDYTNRRAMDLAKELEKKDSKINMDLKNVKPLKYES